MGKLAGEALENNSVQKPKERRKSPPKESSDEIIHPGLEKPPPL